MVIKYHLWRIQHMFFKKRAITFTAFNFLWEESAKMLKSYSLAVTESGFHNTGKAFQMPGSICLGEIHSLRQGFVEFFSVQFGKILNLTAIIRNKSGKSKKSLILGDECLLHTQYERMKIAFAVEDFFEVRKEKQSLMVKCVND